MSKQEKYKESARQIRKLMTSAFIIFMIAAIVLVYLLINPNLSAFSAYKTDQDYVSVPEISDEDYDKIENGIHVRTGFVEGEGLMLVVNNCTNCHSAKLVTQNRMSKERWTATIRWMQETQNLWDLGDNEEPIVKYLATYYAPTQKGRRQNLSNIEWYELKD